MERQYIWTSCWSAARRATGSPAPVRRIADHGVAGNRSGPIPISVSRPRMSVIGATIIANRSEPRPESGVLRPIFVRGSGSKVCFRSEILSRDLGHRTPDRRRIKDLGLLFSPRFDTPPSVPYSETNPDARPRRDTREIVWDCLKHGG